MKLHSDVKDIIFDIDGTIANCEHRQPFLRTKPRNWKAFKAGIMLDTPHHDIIWMAKQLKSLGNRILIATARGEDERELTTKWLHETAKMDFYEKIWMREIGDYRDDAIVKKEILDSMRNEGYTPTMVFDDRDRVVKMWRENGIRCLQVDFGDF